MINVIKPKARQHNLNCMFVLLYMYHQVKGGIGPAVKKKEQGCDETEKAIVWPNLYNEFSNI